MSLLRIGDRIKETTTTTGTGAKTLNGAVTGYREFFNAAATGDYTTYLITDGVDYEYGIGQMTSLTVLTTVQVYQSSNSNAAVNWGAGTKIVELTQASFADTAWFVHLFGDGSDGNVTISSGTTTLTRAMYYGNLTMSGTGILDADGYRVYVAGVLNLENATTGAIRSNGNNGNNSSSATGGTAGAAQFSNSLGGASAGTAGGNSTTTTGAQGAAPGNQNPSNGGAGGQGSAGGTGASGAAGALRAGGTSSSPTSFNRFDYMLYRQSQIQGGAGGAGGGGGGGDGTAGGGGGGGGSGAGMLWLSAFVIQTGGSTVAATIQSVAGNGGNGFAAAAGDRGGGGGGGGGGAGGIVIFYLFKVGAAVTGLILSRGGSGGNGGNGTGTGLGGDGGNGGSTGRITIIDLLNNELAVNQASTAGSTGTNNVGTTAGTGGAVTSVSVTL